MYPYCKIVRMGLIALCCFLFFGPAIVCAQPFGIMSAQDKQKPQHKTLSCPNGRFVFGQISDSGKDQFMLDTVTGRLWRISESGAIGIFLKSVPYRDEKGECSVLPKSIQGLRSKKEAKK